MMVTCRWTWSWLSRDTCHSGHVLIVCHSGQEFRKIDDYQVSETKNRVKNPADRMQTIAPNAAEFELMVDDRLGSDLDTSIHYWFRVNITWGANNDKLFYSEGTYNQLSRG